MTTVASPDLLRDLASFHTDDGCAISVYVDLDPSSVPTIPDVQAKFSALLAGAEKTAEELSRTRDCRLALGEALARIRAWWDGEFQRDGARGVAVFASSATGFFRTVQLVEPVGDSVRIGSRLHVAPLVAALGRDGTLVAVVSRERGHVYRQRAGRLEELVDESEEQPGQHDQGGWAQARYQRHIEHLVHQHLKAVGGELDRRLRRGGVRLVMVAPEEMRGELESRLSNETRAAIVGWTTVEAHAGPPEVLAAVRPLIDEAQSREEQDVCDRWQEEHGRGGRAAAGWRETLEAASDERVDTLLLEEGATAAAWQCPRCGRAAADAGRCALDGDDLQEESDAADLAVHHVLLHGGRVVLLGGGALGDAEGVGALLRF